MCRLLAGWATCGLICGMWSGTPCESFSRARRAPAWSRMPHQLRSAARPNGLQGLAPKDAERVATGNALAAAAHRLLALGRARGLPCGEENPSQSWLWSLASRRGAAAFAQDHCVDDSAFGRTFRATTRLRVWNFRCDELASAVCRGRGRCSFSGRPHLQLTGASKDGFLTRLKQEYPLDCAH